MTSMENIEVYIPKEACVKNIPFQSLSSSMIRKISLHLCHNRSETPEKQIVTSISPVELREKAVSDSIEVRSCMTKITPGKFWLPVVSSSVKAYKVLKSILPAHRPPIQLSVPEHVEASIPVGKASALKKNSFIIFNNQIFLSVKRPRGKRVSFQSLTSPSEFPVPQSQQNQEDAPPSCQTRDTSRPQQSMTQDQTVIRDEQSLTLLQKVSEVTPEEHDTSKEDAEITSDSANSPPKPTEDLEHSQTASSLQMSNSVPNILHQSQSPTQTSSEVSEEPETAGGEGETIAHLETAGFLPMVGSCLAFDFQLLAKEEKISHLRARLKKKEAALSILKSKPSDQV
ncbi:uncharacterized protein si:dkeyp-110g5.4 isoform X2 [Triplophysa dalaica]|uniref:uncharacterized protein si:dkeyp-110g5.4 isoform X2 n=1 Tax=Triplophysa dalaica TaxID=1582913 RepID=UPI0024DFA77C|nr:uncharacterized protein si:dkeyp-110g5.4 isoform X2 [Triplophysa dalaica]